MHPPSGEINGDDDEKGKFDDVADLYLVNPLLIFVLQVESEKMLNSMDWLVDEHVAPMYPEKVVLVLDDADEKVPL